MSATTLSTTGLDKLLKVLKAPAGICRVGILGEKTTRFDDDKSKSGLSNATIGAMHEFGTEHLPQRSFLRVPIADKLSKALDESGLLNEGSFKIVLKEGTSKTWLKQIAIVAEGIVAEAFDSNGFGKWPAWKTPGYENNTGDILVDTQQLRNSITSEVR